MNRIKLQRYIIGLMLAPFLATECVTSELVEWFRQGVSNRFNVTLSQRSAAAIGANPSLSQEVYNNIDRIKDPNIIDAFVDARQLDSVTPVSVLIDRLLVNNLYLTPTPQQVIAGRYLRWLNRKTFNLEDLIATVYLQTNNGGQGNLRGVIAEPELIMIDATKHLLFLQFVGFARQDLEATVHLQRNPGNHLDAPILQPIREEIEAARTLLVRPLPVGPNFTTVELRNLWQGRIREEMQPFLRRRARESRTEAILHFDLAPSRAIDADVHRRIQAEPGLLHNELNQAYQQLKAEYVVPDNVYERGLDELERLINGRFH